MGVEYKPNSRFSLALRNVRDNVKLPQGSFITNLLRARVNYSFTTSMSLNAFIQYNRDTREVTSNVRFNVIHRPLSDIFIVYNEARDLFMGRKQTRQ